MRQSRRRLIVWTALAAMLFGAVSPALAASLFPQRSDVIGRMLALPVPAIGEVETSAFQVDCHTPEALVPAGDARSKRQVSAGIKLHF